MDNKSILRNLEAAIPQELIFQDEPMKNHTSFKIGGPADFLVTPRDARDISRIIKNLRNVPYYVIGNGSNLLVHDEGYRGVIIKIGSAMSRIAIDKNIITAQSGAPLGRVAAKAQEAGLTGLEFASGIPGTLGGAVLMNAGAYDGEMKQVVILTEYVDENGNTHETTEHGFGYRRSFFSDTDYIIVKSKMRLQYGDKNEIKAKMAELNKLRREKQPLEYPSAGSTFKRPEGFFVGKLMEEAGLKGYTVGGAQISEKHGGFVINKGNATCEDVLKLMYDVASEIYGRFGVELEPEIKII